MDITEIYQKHCLANNISFTFDGDIKSGDKTTLFCSSGMQKHSTKFKNLDINGVTIANIQSCLRLNDLDLIGDGTHLLYFNMIGLFSFRDMNIKQAIDFFVEYMNLIGVDISYITIHPDKKEWSSHYTEYDISIKEDPECIWSDGHGLGGYCTEFYHNDIEIGNIVNTCGDCIDVGFGYERLNLIVNNLNPKTNIDILV